MAVLEGLVLGAVAIDAGVVRLHSVNGKATAPWQTPHFSPDRIAIMLILVAPAFCSNRWLWQLVQSSHAVCCRCGKRTSGIRPYS